MSDLNYPAWICHPCGIKHGKPRSPYATYHGGDQCGWCGETTTVTQPRDFGYPPNPRIAPPPTPVDEYAQ